MYICYRCGGEVKPNTKKCKCGSTIFIKVNTNKKKNKDIDFTKSVENVRIPRKGVFVINIESLAKNKSLIIKDEKGVYYIRLPVHILQIESIDTQDV